MTRMAYLATVCSIAKTGMYLIEIKSLTGGEAEILIVDSKFHGWR